MARSKRLRETYAGAVDAVPDALLTLDGSRTLHLPARDRDGPACTAEPDHAWYPVDTEDAIRFGGELCHGCFALALELESRDPASPVERLDSGADPEPDAEIVTRAEADGGRPPALESLTEHVARVTGGSNVYHAPTTHGALCGVETNKADDREHLEGHFRPCRDCFDVDRKGEGGEE